MEINSQLPKTSIYNLLNNQTPKEQNFPIQTPKIEKKSEKPLEVPQNKESHTDLGEDSKKRETYGLLVLELMSNDEYEAFQRATAGMSEGEKMLAAQSLYSLTSFYNGKHTPEIQTQSNAYEKSAQKAFGIEPQNLNGFLEKYKNAYNTAQKVDITL